MGGGVSGGQVLSSVSPIPWISTVASSGLLHRCPRAGARDVPAHTRRRALPDVFPSARARAAVTREWRAALSAALLLLLAGFASAVPRAEAQTAVRSARVGYLTEGPHPSVNFEAFRRGLRDLGWVEGQNLVIEYPAADGRLDRLPALAAGLVASHVDVIVATALAAGSAKAATNAVPIVFVTGADPVATRLVASLARPGANVTGVTTLALELEGQRLGLLKEAMPHLKRVA